MLECYLFDLLYLSLLSLKYLFIQGRYGEMPMEEFSPGGYLLAVVIFLFFCWAWPGIRESLNDFFGEEDDDIPV
jgi:hypothetical protein